MMKKNMKITKIIQIFIVTISISIFLYSQETPITENIEHNQYKQREEAVKAYIKQETEKGKNLLEIWYQSNGLKEQYKNTIEAKAFFNAVKAKKKASSEVFTHCENASSYFIYPPLCQLLEEKYTELEQECGKLKDIYHNTPEGKIYLEGVSFLNEHQYGINKERYGHQFPIKFKKLLKESIDQKLKKLIEEKQYIEKYIIPSLDQEKQELLYSLSLY
jgi:hypothetical protein